MVRSVFLRNVVILTTLVAVSTILVTVASAASTANVADPANELLTYRSSAMPTIDGVIDPVWQNAKPITVYDKVAETDIELRALYNDQTISFLVTFLDGKENRLHKPWIWDAELEAYMLGSQREDTFAFKWDTLDSGVDLSNFSDDSYEADVWYWKAHRTDPVGYADDKMHKLSDNKGKKAQELISTSGKQRYLTRLGDAGVSAQSKQVPTDFSGKIVPQYVTRTPEGSRSDIKAKGKWENGRWTIEFSRALNTGDATDISFSPTTKKSYRFGVSILGLYGEPIDKTKDTLYGQGRISETLLLKFQ